MSNLSLAWNEFLYNGLWLHKEVYVALFQTIFMAVLGTLIAAVFGLPMAFMAAYNVTPFGSVRFVLRRLFDALRGIDMLIWSLIFIRAFGLGPFSGILAIGVTDTGNIGKMMYESIENIDKKVSKLIQLYYNIQKEKEEILKENNNFQSDISDKDESIKKLDVFFRLR